MNNRLKKIYMNPVRYYSRLLKDKNGIDLTVGEGHFNSPFNAKLRAYEALLTNKTKYSSVDGEINLRKKITQKYYPHYTENEILITNGSTQALFNVLLSLITDANDEIIILAPYYPAYLQTVTLLGGTPVIIDTSKSDFKITPEIMKNHVNDKTKAVIINEPNNPTGVTYTVKEKLELINFFKKNNFFVVIDEIYKMFTDANFKSFTEFLDTELKEKFIFINGLSKSHLMTGYRIGYVCGGSSMIKELKKINYLLVSCISTIMQEAAIGALEDDYLPQFVSRYYLKNLQIIQNSLTELGISYIPGNGGYYAFMELTKFMMSGDEFCQYFSKNYNVALVPGTLFGSTYSNFVRISCCRDVKDILKFIDILTEFSNEKTQ